MNIQEAKKALTDAGYKCDIDNGELSACKDNYCENYQSYGDWSTSISQYESTEQLVKYTDKSMALNKKYS